MCRILAKTKDMPREKWLELRKQGIGGSDAGAVCGVNPYSSPMKVFQDKTSDETEEIDNEAVRQGNDLEDYVAQRFMEATGKKVRRSNVMYCNEEYPFMLADVDRLVIGEDAGLECKTVSAYNEDKWKNGEIPLHYILQCYHYMAVTGKKVWYLAAFILGREFICKKLVWDDELIGSLIEAEKSFWHNNIVPRIMPEPDGSEVCDAVLGQYFHTTRKESEIALEGFDEKLGRREKILAQIEKLKEEKRKIEQEVKLFMQDNERASSEKYRVLWSSMDTTRFDTKQFKKDRPELYKDYAQTSSSRRFQVKAA